MSLGNNNTRIFFNVLTSVGLGSIMDDVEDLESIDDKAVIDALARYESQLDAKLASNPNGVERTGGPKDFGSLKSLRVTNNSIQESGARAISRFLEYGGDGLAEVGV